MKNACKLIRTVLAVMAIGVTMSAAEPENAYVVVLREVTANSDRSEPDVQALGGRVLRRDGDRRFVALTEEAARKLEQHPRVLYMQRLWTGPETPERFQPQAAAATVDRVVTTSGEPDWHTGAYAFDKSGNIKSIGADAYAYDSSGRIIQANVSGKPESYQYDAFGNLKMPNGPDVKPATNQIDGATYHTGNLTADARGTYRYDAVSMMTGHTPAGTAITPAVPRRMIYTADDERVAVITMPGDAPATTRIDVRDLGGRVLREFESDGSGTEWRRDYIYAGDRLVAGERQVPTGETGYRHFHLDHLGSTRLITRGGDAARISDPKFFPFGGEADSSTDEYTSFKYSPLEPMKFTGHERDYYGAANVPNDIHLDYMHARYYNAAAGRFLTVDPSREYEPTRPQSWNRYSYALNSALTFVDPDGRKYRIFILQSFAKDATTTDWAPYKALASNGYTVQPRKHVDLPEFKNFFQLADSKDFVFTFTHAAVTGITDAAYNSNDLDRKFDVNPIYTETLAAAAKDNSVPAGFALVGCNTLRPAQQLADMTGSPVVGSVGRIQFRHDKMALKILIDYVSKHGKIDQGAIDQINKAICNQPTGCPNYRYALAQPAGKPQ
jgi:RHS repeat-associated protein